MRFFYKYIFISAFLLLFACDNKVKHYDVDLSEINDVDIDIKSYSRVMFPLAKDSFADKLPEYKEDFDVFLKGDLTDESALLRLKQFFTDPYLIELYNHSIKDYPNFNELEKDLEKSFKYLKYYAPELIPSEVYTYVSGLDVKYPIKFTSDKELIIAIDLYLQSADKIYKSSQIPIYKIKWMNQKSITNDVMLEMATYYMPVEKSTPTLLDNMIRKGKMIYFSKCMNPDKKTNVILKYTESQYNWILENEANVWSLIIENSFLYDNSKQLSTKFMSDGPFSTSFDKASPPRLGEYIGFKIVEKFMIEYEYSIMQLLAETDSQKILQLSKYKPVL